MILKHENGQGFTFLQGKDVLKIMIVQQEI
jgi:hypothetical protein